MDGGGTDLPAYRALLGVTVVMSILSFYYSIPIILIILYAWRSQFVANRTVAQASKIATDALADKALDAYLQYARLNDVAVVKSENYMQNEYVPDKNAIYLSPDTLGSVDLGSIALALHAGAEAKRAAANPGQTAAAKRLRMVESAAFWLAFCFLAIGLMAAMAVVTAIGYAFVAVGFAASAARKRTAASEDDDVVKFVNERGRLSKEQVQTLQETLKALRKIS